MTTVLDTHFNGKLNLARVKLIALFVCSLCKMHTVAVDKLAYSLTIPQPPIPPLGVSSVWVAGFAFDGDLVARLVFSLLPEWDKVKLTIDRTNWQFGRPDFNIFMLGVVYRGTAFPLLFAMPPKRGNSNSAERIALVERFIRLFGSHCIECLVADREFAGEKWIGYLNQNGIRYHIRIRNDFKVFVAHKDREVRASHLFTRFRTNEFVYYDMFVRINGQFCSYRAAGCTGATS